jgi:APA family basic amino acid/polyamine antiporter
VLMARGRRGGARRGTPWLAVAGALGAAYSLWAIAGAGLDALAWGGVLLIVGVPVRFLMGTRKPAAARV